MAVGAALGLLLPRIHAGASVPASRTVEILAAIGFGVLGFVSLIFSLLFVVVQSSNTTFTPRLNLFVDDRWVWRTFAVATGLFACSATAWLAVGDESHVSVAVPIFAFVVVLLTFGLLRHLLLRAIWSLQLNTTLQTLQRRDRDAIDDLYPAGAAPSPVAPAGGRRSGGRSVRWARPPFTLQQIELGAAALGRGAGRRRVRGPGG